MSNNVSFILPALNESKHINGVISSIKKYLTSIDNFEILVIDNGSTDDTASIAEKYGAIVHSKPGVRVGALRNYGAMLAKYEYLVFLDADVYLTQEWQERVLYMLKLLTEEGYAIAGSTCGIGTNPSLIERCWWGMTTQKKKFNYINSGHMIVRRDVFHALGGFDEKLKTGEDAEFCQRPRNVKVSIIHDAKLHVVHEGYPKTWYQFFRRERWHGLGDYTSIDLFKSSRPAMISIAQAVLFVAACSWAAGTGNFFYFMLYPTIVLPISLLAAYRRSPQVNICLCINTGLFLTYFWARTFSLFDALSNRRHSRHR